MDYKENEVIELSAEELAEKNTPEEVEEYILGQAELVSGSGIDWKQKLSSRKLWAAVLAAVMLCVSAIFGDGMSAETLETLRTAACVMMAYIFGEGAVDVARELGSSKVKAAKELTDVWFHSDSGDGDSVPK